MFGGIIPFIGWRKRTVTTDDMIVEIEHHINEGVFSNPLHRERADEFIEDCKKCDVVIIETFEIEWFHYHLLVSVLDRVLIKFKVNDA